MSTTTLQQHTLLSAEWQQLTAGKILWTVACPWGSLCEVALLWQRCACFTCCCYSEGSLLWLPFLLPMTKPTWGIQMFIRDCRLCPRTCFWNGPRVQLPSISFFHDETNRKPLRRPRFENYDNITRKDNYVFWRSLVLNEDYMCVRWRQSWPISLATMQCYASYSWSSSSTSTFLPMAKLDNDVGYDREGPEKIFNAMYNVAYNYLIKLYFAREVGPRSYTRSCRLFAFVRLEGNFTWTVW